VHVHGYIPAVGQGSPPEEIVFTEQQYHASAYSPYSWSNLSQIQWLAASIGLMVGLSLSDRNMRRLLDAVRVTPFRKRQFAILKKPEWRAPKSEELEEIHEKAVYYKDRFSRSGVKTKTKDMGRNVQILEIFQELNRREGSNYTDLLNQMGITPIWYSDHKDVSQILHSVLR
jgi:hypothetical protein